MQAATRTQSIGATRVLKDIDGGRSVACLPLIQMKRVSHQACTNPLMHVRNDIEQLTIINMYITLMNNGATESEDEIHPLTVTCT
jgi:hypothetical protein